MSAGQSEAPGAETVNVTNVCVAIPPWTADRLAAEKTALERMIARTPASQVIDYASLAARLRSVVAELAALPGSARAPARVQLLDKTQRLLRGTLGSDDELADSAEEVDQRALANVRTFLTTLAESDAVCTVRYGDLDVRFDDPGQVRRSLERLSQANLREDVTALTGAFQGVLPRSRSFEFCLADSQQIVKGRIGPGVADPAALNGLLHRRLPIKVLATTVGAGRPRYLLLEMPDDRG